MTYRSGKKISGGQKVFATSPDFSGGTIDKLGEMQKRGLYNQKQVSKMIIFNSFGPKILGKNFLQGSSACHAKFWGISKHIGGINP